MSAFRKMPNEKSVRIFGYSMWIFAIVMAGVVAYLKKYGGPSSLPLYHVLVIVLVVGVVSCILIQFYHTRHQPCPECRKSMRMVGEGFHPKAKDRYLLYCEQCDTIWDTTIPFSND